MNLFGWISAKMDGLSTRLEASTARKAAEVARIKAEHLGHTHQHGAPKGAGSEPAETSAKQDRHAT